LKYFKYWWIGILTVVISLVIDSDLATSQMSTTNNRQQLTNTCPTEIEPLVVLLLSDLPDYANRVIQRTQALHRQAGVDSYVIAAGKPELEPLDLPQIQYNPHSSNSPEQVFFTTLERRYLNNRKIETENYHWLFLTQTSSGWHMVTMFSRFGASAREYPPTPPLETSNGIVGQAISLWLKNCNYLSSTKF
jgi:hypothetical protein